MGNEAGAGMNRQTGNAIDILVVDDMTVSRQILTMLLEQAGFANVQTARASLDAVDAIDRKMPGLIIADFHKPGMDGIEFLRCLRASPATRHIPFILTSADDGNAKILQSWKSGSFQFLAKPFKAGDLIASVRAATGLAIAS